MATPWMKGVMKGWTKKTTVNIVTQSVVDFETVETETETILDCNFQALKPAVVNRKPEEQRTWKWWSIIIIDGPLLKTDDIIEKDSLRFKITSNNNWSESGFQKYEAIEDYEEETEEDE